MTFEKCVLRLAMASRLCDNLISKELLVLSSLLKENAPGLRVSDVHAILGGNKSWVSNLCSRLADAGLTNALREGREVYYNLTEAGRPVAETAFNLIFNLIKTENIPYFLSDQTYLLYKKPIHNKKEEINRLIPPIPIHTHKGALLFNKNQKSLHFIGKNYQNKILCLEISFSDFESVKYGFDDYYKRRKKPRATPLILKFRDYDKEKQLDKEGSLKFTIHNLYLFTNYHQIGRPTQNVEWFELLTKEIKAFQTSEGKFIAIEGFEIDLIPST